MTVPPGGQNSPIRGDARKTDFWDEKLRSKQIQQPDGLLRIPIFRTPALGPLASRYCSKGALDPACGSAHWKQHTIQIKNLLLFDECNAGLTMSI